MKTKLDSFVSVYTEYNKNNIGSLYFSPFNEYSLTPRGFVITNRMTGLSGNLHLLSCDLMKIIGMFSNGISYENAIETITSMKNVSNAKTLIDQLLYIGVIE